MLIFVTNKYLKKKHFGEVVRSFFFITYFFVTKSIWIKYEWLQVTVTN